MITELHLQNFKSWKDTGPMKFAPLTGFFGTNSSGKSSILQALLMMKQTVESSDRSRVLHMGDERSLVDLGTFTDIIHEHDKNASFYISLSWDLFDNCGINDIDNMDTILYQIESLKFHASIKEDDNHTFVEQFDYSFENSKIRKVKFGMKRKAEQKYELLQNGHEPPLIPLSGRGILPPPEKFYCFPRQAIIHYPKFGLIPAILAIELEKLFLLRIAYLGPLREYPYRIYVWAGNNPIDVGKKGENTIPAMLASRAKDKPRKQLDKMVGKWLKKMNMIDSFSLRPIAANRKDYELLVRKTTKSPEVLITDVGFGVSQILPVLVLCYYAPKGSIILLEQPEIHLHPSVQSVLADVFIDVVNNRGVQLIIESHSEHLLRRLQRRIAEEKLSSEKAALYFCAMDNGSSKLEKLDINPYGDICNWPKDFFGDEMDDLVEMTKAKMKRMQQEERHS